jgi:O-antigen/teichoic acid export membrane protein
LLGVSEVSKLALVQRLFLLVTLPLGIINVPLWSAYADARERGDMPFIRRTLKKSIIFTATAALVISVTIVALSQEAINYWTKGTLHVPLSLVVLYGIWAVFESTGSAFAMFLNGAGVIRIQVLIVIMFCLLALPAKLYFVPKYGLNSIYMITVLSYIVAVVIPYLLVFPRINRNLDTSTFT